MPLCELVTEFGLHQDRKQLYVEGRSDRAILEWYLESLAEGQIAVFDIDEIDIPVELLNDHGLTASNKNRVIVLARELDKCLSRGSKQVLCVVDADFDYLLSRLETNRFLAYTDGTSLDMYGVTEESLDGVLKLVFRRTGVRAKDVIKKLSRVLRQVFLIRATNESLKLGLTWLRFAKRCKFQSDGTVAFDEGKFVREYLSGSRKLNRTGEFLQRREELAKKDVGGGLHRSIRGRDFACLLARYLRSVTSSNNAKKLAVGEGIMRMLFIGVDRRDLGKKPLFRRIREFVRG